MPDSDRCPSCGLPRSLNRKLVWTEDGGIYFRAKHSERLIILDHEEISLILEEGVKLRGGELLKTLREKRREFTRSEVASQVTGIRRTWLRLRPLAGRIITEAFREAAFYGCGNLSISRLRPGKEMTVKIQRPYHPYLLAGDIWGFWEGLFGVEALVSLTTLSETEYEITVKTAGKHRGSWAGETPPRRPDRDYELEVCEKCRLPAFPYQLRWDPDLGTIYHSGTHRHLVITSVRGWRMVLEEINGSRQGELPPSVGEAVSAKAAKDCANLPGGNYRAAYRHFFMSLPLLGWGKPKRVTRKPFLMEAHIEGVPFPQLLSWKINGVYQALERETPEVDFRSAGDSVWKYLVSPRLEGSFLPVSSLASPADLPVSLRVILPF